MITVMVSLALARRSTSLTSFRTSFCALSVTPTMRSRTATTSVPDPGEPIPRRPELPLAPDAEPARRTAQVQLADATTVGIAVTGRSASRPAPSIRSAIVARSADVRPRERTR